MAKRDRYGAARKKRKRSALFAPMSFLLVCVAVVFGMGVFFRVQTIEVDGVESYTPEEIIEASGIGEGDNLFFINQANAAARIYSRLTMVETAEVETVMPNKVVIHVQESYPMAYVDWMGSPWILTGNCKMLGTPQAPEELNGLIQVLNITAADPEQGKPMQVVPEDSLKLTYLQDLLGAMEQLNMGADVAQLDMSNAANPTFQYLNRFTVRMGANNNTDYKLRMLLSGVPQLAAEETGTINLSDGVTVRFTPN